MRSLFALLLTFFGVVILNAQTDSLPLCMEPAPAIQYAAPPVVYDKPLMGVIPFAEVTGQNIGVWAWSRYVLDKGYSRINASTMRQNMENGFNWDRNHYAINFFGHPYQGSFYYTAARSAGYDFYPSFAYTALGSFTWEMFMERENPSMNDLIVTTLGGVTFGEMLTRISAHLENHPRPNRWRQAGAFVTNPMGHVNHMAFGKRGNDPGYVPLDFSFRMGPGSHVVSDYSYAHEDIEDSKNSWKGKSLAWGLELSYGKPGRRVLKPFDHFTLNYNQIIDEEGTLLSAETMGILKNFTLTHRDSWMDLSIQMSYDVMYGDLAEMSANSIGPSIEFSLMLTDSLRMQMANRAGWVVLGASDFNYEDVLVAQDSSLAGELRTYQLGTGFNYKNLLLFEWIGHGLFQSQSSVYGLSTMPKSEPHYGARGWDFVARHDARLEAYLPKNFSLGYSFDVYWKIAAYRQFEPIARTMASNWLYLKYRF